MNSTTETSKICNDTCTDFGKLDFNGDLACFNCSDFSSAQYAHRIFEAVDAGDFEADEDLMKDFNKFIKLRLDSKYVPTIKRQASTFSDKLAIWIVQKAGTMNFTYACAVMVTIPLFWDKAMPVVQYLSSAYLQLLFLPIILVAGNLQQKRAELREQSAYKIQLKQDIQIEWLRYKLDKLKEQLNTMARSL